MSNGETTAAVQRGARAAEEAVMGYTRPDGTYVQGAVNFWDDSVESGELIAAEVLSAALDVEEMARALREHRTWADRWVDNKRRYACLCGAALPVGTEVLAPLAPLTDAQAAHQAAALRAAILGGAS